MESRVCILNFLTPSMRIGSWFVGLFVTWAVSCIGQDSITGTWKVGGVAFAPWTFTLRAEGNKVTGTVSQRGLDPQEAPGTIYGGAIEGNQVTFKCDSADGGRTITFSGVVAGDSITFTREVNVHPGQWPGMEGVYGAYGPSHFTARRVVGPTAEAGIITTSPPKTSLTDVMLLFACSLVIGGALHLIRGNKVWLSQEIAGVRKRCSIVDSSRCDVPTEEMAAVRNYHRSWMAFLLSWVPFLILVAGGTCCSLLRDAGYLIFPWPLLTVALLSALAFALTQTIRVRSIKRLLLRGPNKPMQPTPR